MLHMRGHVSASFFAVTYYFCKVVFVILLQVCKVNFFWNG